jgi:hypothetical protein
MAEGKRCCAWPLPDSNRNRDAYKDCIKVLPVFLRHTPSFLPTIIYMPLPSQIHNINVERGGGKKIRTDLRSSEKDLLKDLEEAHQVTNTQVPQTQHPTHEYPTHTTPPYTTGKG